MTLLDFLTLAKHHMPAFSHHIDGFIADISNYPDLVGTTTSSDGYNYIAPAPTEKTFKVVFLESAKPQFPNETILHYGYNFGGSGTMCLSTCPIRTPHVYMNMYAVTNDVILENDYYIDIVANKLGKSNHTYDSTHEYYKKVICSTEDLDKAIDCPDNIPGCEVYHTIAMPRFSEKFLEKVIQDYNNCESSFYSCLENYYRN